VAARAQEARGELNGKVGTSWGRAADSEHEGRGGATAGGLHGPGKQESGSGKEFFAAGKERTRAGILLGHWRHLIAATSVKALTLRLDSGAT